jgi:hypothetical protein
MRTTPEYTARLVRDHEQFQGRRYPKWNGWRVRFYQNGWLVESLTFRYRHNAVMRASWWRKRNRREVAA